MAQETPQILTFVAALGPSLSAEQDSHEKSATLAPGKENNLTCGTVFEL
jgi:hypothetical protein